MALYQTNKFTYNDEENIVEEKAFEKTDQQQKQKRTSRRKQQRKRKREEKFEEAAWKVAIEKEKHQIKQETNSGIKKIHQKIESTYGFIADPSLSISHNKTLYLSRMPTWFYFVRPSHTSFHNLRTNKTSAVPYNIISLLGLGLKFCQTPRYTLDKSTIDTTINRHRRDLWLKNYFLDAENLDNDD